LKAKKVWEAVKTLKEHYPISRQYLDTFLEKLKTLNPEKTEDAVIVRGSGAFFEIIPFWGPKGLPLIVLVPDWYQELGEDHLELKLKDLSTNCPSLEDLTPEFIRTELAKIEL
jgi:hypothetical protein